MVLDGHGSPSPLSRPPLTIPPFNSKHYHLLLKLPGPSVQALFIVPKPPPSKPSQPHPPPKIPAFYTNIKPHTLYTHSQQSAPPPPSTTPHPHPHHALPPQLPLPLSTHIPPPYPTPNTIFSTPPPHTTRRKDPPSHLDYPSPHKTILIPPLPPCKPPLNHPPLPPFPIHPFFSLYLRFLPTPYPLLIYCNSHEPAPYITLHFTRHDTLPFPPSFLPLPPRCPYHPFPNPMFLLFPPLICIPHHPYQLPSASFLSL